MRERLGPLICLEPPRIHRMHLTAKFAFAPPVLSLTPLVAYFFLQHLGRACLVSANSFGASVVHADGPLPLIEIDTNVAALGLADGPIPLNMLHVEIAPDSTMLCDGASISYAYDDETSAAMPEVWADCRPEMVVRDSGLRLRVLSGPRVHPDGRFILKVIQLPVKCARVLRVLRTCEAVVLLDGTPLGTFQYSEALHLPDLGEPLANGPPRLVHMSNPPVTITSYYPKPVSVLQVYGADRLAEPGPVPLESLTIVPEPEPEDVVSDDPPSRV